MSEYIGPDEDEEEMVYVCPGCDPADPPCPQCEARIEAEEEQSL